MDFLHRSYVPTFFFKFKKTFFFRGQKYFPIFFRSKIFFGEIGKFCSKNVEIFKMIFKRCWKKSVKAPTGNLGQARQRSGKPHRPPHRIFRSGKAKVRQAPPTPPPPFPENSQASQASPTDPPTAFSPKQSGKSGKPHRPPHRTPKKLSKISQASQATLQNQSGKSGNPPNQSGKSGNLSKFAEVMSQATHISHCKF